MAKKILPSLVTVVALIAACGTANAGLLRSLAHGAVFGAGVAVATGAAHAAAERCHNVMDPQKGHKVLSCANKNQTNTVPAADNGN
jgi:hypothetical protein